MQKILFPFMATLMLAACSGPKGSTPSTKEKWQADNVTYYNGWKCLLVGENAEKKDIFISRKDYESQFHLTIHEYAGDRLSPHWMNLDGNALSIFIFENDSVQSFGTFMNGPALTPSQPPLPVSIVKGYLLGNVDEGFTLLKEELVDQVTGDLLSEPVKEELAVIEDCREAQGEINWDLRRTSSNQ